MGKRLDLFHQGSGESLHCASSPIHLGWAVVPVQLGTPLDCVAESLAPQNSSPLDRLTFDTRTYVIALQRFSSASWYESF